MKISTIDLTLLASKAKKDGLLVNHQFCCTHQMLDSWGRIPLSSSLPGDNCYEQFLAVLVALAPSYYTGTFNTVNRSTDGRYVAVSSRGNFYLTWEPGQPFWQPHNRSIARRIQNMGWRADGGLWLLVRGGGLFLNKGTGVSGDFEEVPVQSRGFGIIDVGYQSEVY